MERIQGENALVIMKMCITRKSAPPFLSCLALKKEYINPDKK